MTETFWPAVRTIYADGIASGHATFETNPPTGWAKSDGTHVREPRLVAVDDERVLGWVAATPVSARAVYRGVIERSVYIASDARGTGVGSLLIESFITAAEENGHWTIQSSVFPENTASLRLHKGAGFRVVGRRERIALMSYGPAAGTWRDTILIERRTSLNGTL